MADTESRVSFEIVEQGAVLNDQNSWNLEINRVSWMGKAAKWDIRSWNENHTQCSKGITLTDAELAALKIFVGKLEVQ